MQRLSRFLLFLLLTVTFFHGSCSENENDPDDGDPGNGSPTDGFYFGADLSYANQILDFGGTFKDEDEVRDPYRIFKDHGTNLARFRLWHNPQWTKDVYGAEGKQLYNDLLDVEKSITEAKSQGLEVLLDFHYSDVWADPGSQKIPEAWTEITSIEVLEDSVYNYTFTTLKYLADKGLMPEFVQVGNETNCGMMYSEAPVDFPKLNVCDENWQNMGKVVNSAIKAIRELDGLADVDTRVILHVADPVHIQWWFDNMINEAKVTDFDIIGFSYYPVWHDGISIKNLGTVVSTFKKRYSRDLMILETAYPWTPDGNDNYNNIFGADQEIDGYPLTKQGQKAMMHDITQQMISGGGIGIIYWEPAWITSQMKDLWGTGSAWENCTFFDYGGNVHEGISFIKDEYE